MDGLLRCVVAELYLEPVVITDEEYVDGLIAEVQVVNLGFCPVGGQVGIDRNGVGRGIKVDAEESAKSRDDDHGAGPELVAGAAAHGNVEIAGKKFGDCAGILGPGEVNILHEHLLAGEWVIGAVLGEGCPAREERPD